MVYNNTHRWQRRLVQTDRRSSYRPDIPCNIKIVHLCLIWCHVVRSRDVHPCYLVCVVQSRDVSPHNFDGLAMSVLAISVAPLPVKSVP